LDPTGLVYKISDAALAIDFGRKGFAIRGKADEGRLSYENGITAALSAFKDAQSTIDPHIIILIEYTFLNQELQFCDETDTDSLSSLTQAFIRLLIKPTPTAKNTAWAASPKIHFILPVSPIEPGYKTYSVLPV
jgi:hypothetical protein